MADQDDEIGSLRMALAAAERARDEALAVHAATLAGQEADARENQFRLRNMFSVIRAIARRTGEHAETVEDYRGILDGRLSSYLHVQAAVSGEWARGMDLALLLGGELLRFDMKEDGQVRLEGPPVSITSAAAGLLALAFHDLASGAIVAGELEKPGNSLEVSWRLIDEGEGKRGLSIEWREAIEGLREDHAMQTSWGEWIGQAIRHQLSGALSLTATPTMRSAVIHLPAAALV